MVIFIFQVDDANQSRYGDAQVELDTQRERNVSKSTFTHLVRKAINGTQRAVSIKINIITWFTMITSRKLVAALLAQSLSSCEAFQSSPFFGPRSLSNERSALFMNKEPSKSDPSTTVIDKEEEDDEVYGAKFFGGNQIKEDLFDTELEAVADQTFREISTITEYNRFDDLMAFGDVEARNFALRLQNEINVVTSNFPSTGDRSVYANSFSNWETPLKSPKGETSSPIQTLREAKEFYKDLDIAIVTGEKVGESSIEVTWVISVIWPNMWEARVALSGKSLFAITYEDDVPYITSQKDTLEGFGESNDVIKAISGQFFPRFWDVYNIGISPAAEEMQKLYPVKKLFSSYTTFEIAPRLVMRPSINDKQGRSGRNAQIIPMHSFTTIVKTTGPAKDLYSTTTPIEVGIKPKRAGDGQKFNQITWTIPIGAKSLKNPVLPFPEEGDDDAQFKYEMQKRRRVATIPFGGDPQDEDVGEVRKKLYEAVTQDGFVPKLDEDGRPMFFFLQNDSKACFTEAGLGMAVYESRPNFAKSNEIGIELTL